MLFPFVFKKANFAVIYFLSHVHDCSPSAFSSVGGDDLSLSAFLLDGPYKDGAVNHPQTS